MSPTERSRVVAFLSPHLCWGEYFGDKTVLSHTCTYKKSLAHTSFSNPNKNSLFHQVGLWYESYCDLLWVPYLRWVNMCVMCPQQKFSNKMSKSYRKVFRASSKLFFECIFLHSHWMLSLKYFDYCFSVWQTTLLRSARHWMVGVI